MEAILVTFQEHVIVRGAALSRLREAQGPIIDSEHYTLLRTLARNCVKTSPWRYFFVAVNRAAIAHDRIGVVNQLDEAEKILLSIAQVRHQIMTGARVSESDLRRSYLDAIERYIHSAKRRIARSSHAGSPAAPLLRLHQLSNNERLNQKNIKDPTEPSQKLRSDCDTRSSSKLVPRGSETTGLADVLAELRLALRNQSRVLAMGCLAVFAISIYLSAPLFAEHWRFNIGGIINAPEPAISQLSPGPPKISPQITPKVAAQQQMPLIVRDVNVHGSPGTSGEIISTLRRGVSVAVIETRDYWALIKADSANGKGQPLVGWVSISFLSGTQEK